MKINEQYQVLSCIQPSGDMHLGNYFGAVKNWVDMQQDYKCIFGVVDLHVMTLPYEPETLRRQSNQMTVDLMACGIDPERSILFVQSLVPEHTELAWVFNCLASFGELNKQTQFKDKTRNQEDKGKSGFISGGLFTYPVLQAADILIYRAKYVPVGKDQEQHLELTRNIAQRFNHRFGDYFPEPEAKFTEIPKLMSLADPTRKMSKSLGEKHYVGLFEDEASIRKKIRSAVTDSGDTPEGEMSAGVANLFELLKASGGGEALAGFQKDFEAGALRYGDLKNAVADSLVNMINPLREKREELMSTPEVIDTQIREMSEKAREIARETISDVRDLIGVKNASFL
jgi:tryptophanyl-tRNA synthetase